MSLQTTIRSLVFFLLSFGVNLVGAGVAAILIQQKAAAQTGAVTQQSFSAAVRNDLAQENFARLDTTASQARATKERFPNAEWKLAVFYNALIWPAAGEKATEEEWQSHFNRLRKWAKQSTDSITPRVALGNSLVEFAWKARVAGQEWNNFESQVGGKLFQERLRTAEKALTDNNKTAAKCPHWYLVMLSVALGQNWSWERYNNVFSEGTSLEPHYYYLYQAKAFNMLPRNHGGHGEWEKFAETSYQRLSGKEGAITYFMLASRLRHYFGNNFFKENKVSLAKIIEGFTYIEESYGVSNSRLNEAALFASLAGDRALAQGLFNRIGENWDAAMWKGRAEFEVYRNLARQATAQAALQKVSNTTASAAPNYQGLTVKLSSPNGALVRSRNAELEMLLENTTRENRSVNALELSSPVLSLSVTDAAGKVVQPRIPPQLGGTKSDLKILAPSEQLRYVYRLSLLPGAYTIKMKKLSSNELKLRIIK